MLKKTITQELSFSHFGNRQNVTEHSNRFFEKNTSAFAAAAQKKKSKLLQHKKTPSSFPPFFLEFSREEVFALQPIVK